MSSDPTETDPTEVALTAHLRRRSARITDRPEGDALHDVVARSGRLRRIRRARRLALSSAAAVIAVVGTVLVVPGDGDRSGPSARTADEQAPTSASTETTETTLQETALPGVMAPSLPLDPFRTSFDQIAVGLEARNVLIRACLDDSGFEGRAYPGSEPLAAPVGLPDTSLHSTFGVFNDAEVLERGYRPIQWNIEAERHAAIAAGTTGPTLTEQYGADLLTAWTVCDGSAGVQLRGGPQDMASPSHPANAIGELQGEAQHLAEADPRIDDVVAAWSACMAGKGYAYAHPLDPGAAFAVEGATTADPLPPLDDVEIATGLADVACKTEVGFADTWYAVLAEHQQALVDTHQAEIQAGLDWYAAMHARAQAVLNGEVPPS